jgi:tetratricopeptide (TPR) repeat protein
MKFFENQKPEDKKADWHSDQFPRLDGRYTTPVEDASEASVALLMRWGTHLDMTRRPVLAARYLFQAMRKTKDIEKKARLALSIGILAEKISCFEIAVSYYRVVIELNPSHVGTIYLGQNNLGYSLNQLGLYEEGEIHCRNSIATAPRRPNGHKNLGLSLWGQGRFREAAHCFVNATRESSLDSRSTKHLEDLLAERPEIAGEFFDSLEWCRKKVRNS